MKRKLMIFSLIIMTIALVTFNKTIVNADEVGTSFSISTGIETLQGTTIDTEYTVTFKITQTAKNGTAVTETSDGITITNGIYKIGSTYGNKGSITQGIQIRTNTSYPGTYDFLVKEEFANSVTDSKGVLCLDPVTYTIQLVVTSTSTTPTLTIQNNKTNDKVEKIEFSNTYISKVDTGIVVNTTTTGTGADTDLEFPYQITITYPAVYENDAAENEIEKEREALTKTLGVTPTTNGNSDTYVVYLKSGESIDTGSLPTGTTYTVQEILEETTGITYNEKYAEYDNGNGVGKNSQTYTGTVNEESASTVSITNARNTATPAGIVIDNLPYIAMIVIGFAGFSLMIIKKRKFAKK